MLEIIQVDTKKDMRGAIKTAKKITIDRIVLTKPQALKIIESAKEISILVHEGGEHIDIMDWMGEVKIQTGELKIDIS